MLAPMPSPSVRIATAVKPGDLRSVRSPNHRSRQQVSTPDSQVAERTRSFVTSGFPHSMRTARSASWWLRPAFIFSAAAISRNPFNSSSNSIAERSVRNNDRRPAAARRKIDITSPYVASKILAIAVVCLSHSRVSLLSLVRPFRVRA